MIPLSQRTYDPAYSTGYPAFSHAIQPILPGLTLQEIEKRAIQQALERNEWRKVATAKELGIYKNTLRRKIIRLGINRASE